METKEEAMVYIKELEKFRERMPFYRKQIGLEIAGIISDFKL